jgi:hypothetical protein
VNVASWALWGFVATVLLTTLLGLAQLARFTRMNLMFVLGALFTPDRDRARVYGMALHLVDGWMFSLLYVAAFHMIGRATWWIGGGIALVHSAFLLAVVLPMLPGAHPRMASEVRGPTVTRQLEPPGFLGLNYGVRTPIALVLAHLVFGVVLGAFYQLP